MFAAVVKLADTLASGASARKGVRVQVPPAAPITTFLQNFAQFPNFSGQFILKLTIKSRMNHNF